ncbi:unnamed protein product [Prunus armeniaca]|uniref:Uncharacterized protein n=1 Tax=Prunus armeniaca TaxID=36596 RepID=A0A6J5WJK6_PRUAR|nr:unnamed protein product [Prunus armeniaca]
MQHGDYTSAPYYYQYPPLQNPKPNPIPNPELGMPNAQVGLGWDRLVQNEPTVAA